MTRSAATRLRTASMVLRTVTLAAAWCWAGAVVAFTYGYHLAQPSTPWAEYDGHTYFTHLPAQTLAQSDHMSAEIVTFALCLTLTVGTADLVVRLACRLTAPGVAALTAGGMLVAFSLFGLLRGLAGIGTAGALLVLSGLPMRSTCPGDPAPQARPVVPARWYPDPTGRHDLRFWDGSAWSSHVATGGRSSADPV